MGDFDNEIYFLGDLNIDWNMTFCSIKEMLISITNASNLVQMVDKLTGICMRRDGTKSSTLINHVFTNCSNLCSKSLPIPVGCSDHNLVVLVQKAKVPKAGPKAIIRRFNEGFFVNCPL